MIIRSIIRNLKSEEILLVIVRCISIVMSYYLMIILTKESINIFGRYTSILSLTTFSAVLFSFGMKTYLFKKALRNSFRIPKVSGKLLLVSSLAVVVVVLVSSRINFIDKIYVSGRFDMASLIYLTVTQLWILVLNESNRAAKKFFKYELFKSVIRPITVVICLLLWNRPIDKQVLFVVLCVANSAQLLLVLCLSVRYKSIIAGTMTAVLKESKEFWFLENTSNALAVFPILIIDFCASDFILGFSSTLLKVSAIFTVILGFVNTVAGPGIALRRSLHEARTDTKIRVYFKYCFLTSIVLFLSYVLFSKVLLDFFKLSFDEYFWPASMIVLSGAINLATGPSGQMLVLQGYERLVTSLGIQSLGLFALIIVIGQGTLMSVACAFLVQSFSLNVTSYAYVLFKTHGET